MESKELKQNKGDDNNELDNQFILRMPQHPVQPLNKALADGNLKRLTIKFDSEHRSAEVVFDGKRLEGKLWDLPTKVESLKTTDKVNTYKSADISQMLVCKEVSTTKSPNSHSEEGPTTSQKSHLWPHSITPCLKNVRKNCFRKNAKNQLDDVRDVEKEPKQLLRMDNAAVRTKYEIVYQDVTSDKNIQSDKVDDAEKKDSMRTVSEEYIFGEEVSSSDDKDQSDESHTPTDK